MFDKKRCIDNIYSLVKAKGLKIGDIEENAGVSKGYLSRINKEDNTSSPTIEVLASIAEQLGVGIDYLVNFPQELLTPNEQFVFKFIDRLNEQTITGKLDWEVESASILSAETDTEVDNPLVSVTTRYSQEFERDYQTHEYSSQLYSGNVTVSGNCYHTILPDRKTTVYINAVTYQIPNNDEYNTFNTTDRQIEIYIVHRGVRPVCSTFYLRAELKTAVESLYDAVSSSPSHIGLSQDTKEIMQSFLTDTEDLPF